MLSRFLRNAPLRSSYAQPLAVRSMLAARTMPVARQFPVFNSMNMNFTRSYSDGPAPLTREFALQRVMDVLANFSKIDPAKIKPEARLEEDIGLDSLDVVDFLFYTEEEFTVQMPDAVVSQLKTVQDVADWIYKQPDAF